MLKHCKRLSSGVHLDIKIICQTHILDWEKVERDCIVLQLIPDIWHIRKLCIDSIQHNKH